MSQLDIRTAIIDRLKAEVTMVEQRVHRVKAPQGTGKPFCTIRLLSPGRLYVFGGVSELYQPQMQVQYFAASYDACAQVSKQIISAMENWPAANSLVQAVIMQPDQEEDWEVDSELYSGSLTFTIYHN